ncbi:PAS domain-containing protein [Kaistia dalseonensis]|uniref:Blue-light-activated histidine kinase n=1 Tax=Kaistia dalseonensis TaxID=410840 RepID=A0ABU0HDF6_9HYPH|nr:HWE histidine kinase domain-containing protein [Kaistia dalseonensis]MCX5497720.1 PAS domain-containing protein [Kaistia dalseonensis]MDQ0440364.1 PAS domain S-box-containing protein [Kaistia dalseonensis]
MSAILGFLFGPGRPLPPDPVSWTDALLYGWPDLLIAICAIVIAVAAIRFRRRRGDLPAPYRRAGLAIILLLIAVAIRSLTAFLHPLLPLSGGMGLIAMAAALLALTAAILARFVVPELLALPSARQMERANQHLKSEIQAHIDTMRQLTDVRNELEEKVARRTSELTQTNQRFEAALTGSDIAVFTQDRDLIFTWAYDPRLGRLFGDVVGKTDDAVFPPPVAAEVASAKRGVVETGHGASINVAVPSEDGDLQYLRLSIEPLRDAEGETIGLTSAVVDLTERHDYETRLSALTSSLAQANARFDLALRGSSISVFSQDTELRYNWVYNPPVGLSADELIGKSDSDMWDGPEVSPLLAIKQGALSSGEVRTGDVVLPIGGSEHHFKVRVEPILGTDHEPIGLAGVAVDTTEAHRQEAHLRLVMRELTHRSKNLLAVIQAMARQTAARSDDPETFVIRFSARLRAMAASQDLLVAQEWHGASLRELVEAQLAQAVEPGSGQVAITGPDLSLKPDAAQNIGLALHELTTNASKYGALSSPGGRILLSWSIRDGGLFRLHWEEQGGPEARKPQRTGFGVTLLERTVGQALDGTVELDFRPSGVVCNIDIPASHVKA